MQTISSRWNSLFSDSRRIAPRLSITRASSEMSGIKPQTASLGRVAFDSVNRESVSIQESPERFRIVVAHMLVIDGIEVLQLANFDDENAIWRQCFLHGRGEAMQVVHMGHDVKGDDALEIQWIGHAKVII